MSGSYADNYSIYTYIQSKRYAAAAFTAAFCAQTVFDFEWLIVDDGSTDGTEAAAGSFSSARFPVRYIKKENGGKHTAYNLALQQATGTYFLCVDSDDLLVPDAMEALRKAASSECGICAYKSAADGKSLSTEFPPEIKETTFFGFIRASLPRGVHLSVSPADCPKSAVPCLSGRSICYGKRRV